MDQDSTEVYEFMRRSKPSNDGGKDSWLSDRVVLATIRLMMGERAGIEVTDPVVIQESYEVNDLAYSGSAKELEMLDRLVNHSWNPSVSSIQSPFVHVLTTGL